MGIPRSQDSFGGSIADHEDPAPFLAHFSSCIPFVLSRPDYLIGPVNRADKALHIGPQFPFCYPRPRKVEDGSEWPGARNVCETRGRGPQGVCTFSAVADQRTDAQESGVWCSPAEYAGRVDCVTGQPMTTTRLTNRLSRLSQCANFSKDGAKQQISLIGMVSTRLSANKNK